MTKKTTTKNQGLPYAHSEDGITLISKERHRQVVDLGYTLGRDQYYTDGQLAMAAICYAAVDPITCMINHEYVNGNIYFDLYDPWPWDEGVDKRRKDRKGNPLHANRYTTKQRIRNLTKAGALIAAEIDRLLALGKGK